MMLADEEEGEGDPRCVDESVTASKEDGVYDGRYTPTHKGVHRLAIRYRGLHIEGSPFKVRVDAGIGPVAFGPGLEHAVVGHKAPFTVDVRDGSGESVGHGGHTVEVELTDLLLRLEPLAPEQSAAMRRKVRGVGERLAAAKAKCLG